MFRKPTPVIYFRSLCSVRLEHLRCRLQFGDAVREFPLKRSGSSKYLTFRETGVTTVYVVCMWQESFEFSRFGDEDKDGGRVIFCLQFALKSRVRYSSWKHFRKAPERLTGVSFPVPVTANFIRLISLNKAIFFDVQKDWKGQLFRNQVSIFINDYIIFSVSPGANVSFQVLRAYSRCFGASDGLFRNSSIRPDFQFPHFTPSILIIYYCEQLSRTFRTGKRGGGLSENVINYLQLTNLS